MRYCLQSPRRMPPPICRDRKEGTSAQVGGDGDVDEQSLPLVPGGLPSAGRCRECRLLWCDVERTRRGVSSQESLVLDHGGDGEARADGVATGHCEAGPDLRQGGQWISKQQVHLPAFVLVAFLQQCRRTCARVDGEAHNGLLGLYLEFVSVQEDADNGDLAAGSQMASRGAFLQRRSEDIHPLCRWADCAGTAASRHGGDERALRRSLRLLLLPFPNDGRFRGLDGRDPLYVTCS